MAPNLLSSVFLLPLLLYLFNFLTPVLGTCPRGEVLESGRCKLCPPGTYKRFRFVGVTTPEERNRCLKCPAGTFNPHFGAISKALCRPCYPGTATNTTGSTSCNPCPAGTVAKRGAKACLACGPGTFYSDFDFLIMEANPSVCKPCPINYFSTGSANLECEQCPLGFTTADRGSTSSEACELCPAAKETYPGGKGCNNCDSGRFKPAVAPGRCLLCAPGFISKGDRNLQCKSCAVGFFEKSNKCERCPEGLTTAKRGATQCRRFDYPCPPGTFENKRGDCERCEVGYKVNKKKGKCEKCPANMSSPGGAEDECTACPSGQIAEEGSFCRCPDGRVLNADSFCVKCPAGTFKNIDNVDYPSATECQKCDYGFFSKEGSGSCKKCPQGTVANKEGFAQGSTGCKECPEGMMPNIPFSDFEEGLGCVDVRTGCPLGWKRKEVGASIGPIHACQRVICTVGTKPEDIGRKCVPCDEGERLDNSGKNCKRCSRKSISLGGIVTSCTPCPDGKFPTFTSPPMCNCKRAGFGVREGKCQTCLSGTYSDLDTELCRKCPPGTFASKKKTFRCTDCPFGTIAAKEGAIRVWTLPKGYETKSDCCSD